MREFILTDRQLQALIAPALRRKLKAAGFQTGETNADIPPTFCFPINLGVAGVVSIFRSDDGIWTFRQHDSEIERRVEETFEEHAAAQDSQCRPKGA